MKVYFCPVCGLRHYFNSNDKVNTKIICINCATIFHIPLTLIDEFDYKKYPNNWLKFPGVKG